MDVVAALTPVVEALEALAIPYRLGGSVASSLYGTPRATNDVDLVADIRREHIAPLCRRLEGEYVAEPELLAMAIATQSCCNFIHLPTVYKVDVFVRKRSAYDDAAFARSTQRTLVEAPGAKVFLVTTAEDTVLRKLSWYRAGECVSQQQWRDVAGVLAVQAGRLDLAYMQHWARELGVDDLLARAQAEATR